MKVHNIILIIGSLIHRILIIVTPVIQLVACVLSGAIRDNGDCKRIFKEDFSIEASDQDCEIIRRVCEAVSTRAARLAASGVVALVKKINKISGCSVAVDGSLYKLHPKFPERYCIINPWCMCVGYCNCVCVCVCVCVSLSLSHTHPTQLIYMLQTRCH